MNLIERLGGYQAARDSLQWLIDHDDEYQQEKSNMYSICLDYRREHGIFEVGDKVVIQNKPYSSHRLHVILRVENSGYFVAPIHGDLTMHMLGCMASDFYLCHATDEEIQAGRGLEVCGG